MEISFLTPHLAIQTVNHKLKAVFFVLVRRGAQAAEKQWKFDVREADIFSLKYQSEGRESHGKLKELFMGVMQS